MDEISKTDNFKVPLLPTAPHNAVKKPPTHTFIKRVKSDTDSEEGSIIKPSDSNCEQKSNKPEATSDSKCEHNLNKPKKTTGKSLISVPLSYTEPEWSGHPPSNYSFEIIKNGTFVSNLPIRASLMVFGRLDVCDLVFEHPSVSRYHAVVQYCKGDDTHPKGFYLYDLNSTHGTFINKNKITPNIYYKLKVGYILKFGGSTRLHIFQGPEEEDEEAEQKKSQSTVETDEGCSWGMAEEAEEDEEELADNPFALSTLNEDTYIDDPKKTLRGWFEREGYELEYNVEEKGFKTFSCTIKLPIDTASGEYMPVEASVSGKKKEAVIACALEACRTLDRMGLLRQSHHESRQPKRKKWEENDYYDSDEDTFYDRTGEIEKRREMRKRLSKKVEVDNFESLSVKLEKLNAEMNEIKSKISSHTKNTENTQSSESDPLDMYMSNLSDTGSSISDKFERRKMKLRLIELEKEKVRLEKLTDIARPATIPQPVKRSGFIGKKLKSKLTLPAQKEVKVNANTLKVEGVEENDSDEEINPSKISENVEETTSGVKYGLILNPSSAVENVQLEAQEIEQMDCDVESNKIKSVTDSPINKELDVKEIVSKELAENNDSIVDTSISENDLKTPPSKTISNENMNKNARKLAKRRDKSAESEIDVYKTSSSEYCTWVPPSNQSGDGYTSLNDKYGY